MLIKPTDIRWRMCFFLNETNVSKMLALWLDFRLTGTYTTVRLSVACLISNLSCLVNTFRYRDYNAFMPKRTSPCFVITCKLLYAFAPTVIYNLCFSNCFIRFVCRYYPGLLLATYAWPSFVF